MSKINNILLFSGLLYFSFIFSGPNEDDLNDLIEHDNELSEIIAKSKSANITEQDRFGVTPLHVAVNKNNIELVKLFLNKVSNSDHYLVLDKDGNTPFHVAAKKGFLDIVKLLLNTRPTKWLGMVYAKSEINKQNKDGNTALHLAVISDKKDVVAEILTNDYSKNLFDLNIKNNAGDTLFHEAALRGEGDILNLLLLAKQPENNQIKKIDYNLKNNNGDTLLHILVKEYKPYYLPIIKELLKKDIDVNLQDNANQTALDYAIKAKNKELIDLLKEKMAQAPKEVDSKANLNNLNGTLVGLSKKTK